MRFISFQMKIFLCLTATLFCTLPLLVTADECKELDAKLSELTCDYSEFEDYSKCIKERKEVRRKRQLICPITGLPIDQVVDPILVPQGEPQYVQPIITQDILPAQQVQVQPAYAQSVATQEFRPAQQVQQTVMQPAQSVQYVQQVVDPIVQQSVQPSYVEPIVTQDVVDPMIQQVVEQPRYILQANPDDINRNVEIIGENSTTYQHSERIPAARNITTVIKLNNYINNTNHINVPTHINTTNINNITVFTNFTDSFGLGATAKGPCCFAVQPKRCHTSPVGPRCHHKRHKTCGQQCTARTIHVRAGHSGRVNYVPQPSPKCIYTDNWPYVNCGHRRRDPCDGCYDDPYYAPPPHCNGCYDDGFEYGQLYRRGPVLRPYYQPQAPCYLSGACEYDDYDYGSGQPEMYDDSEPSNSTEVEGELGTVLHKCRVVSDDGSISIKNCTVEQDNPYATAPFRDRTRNHRSYMPPPPPPPPPMPYYYMPPPGYPYGYPYPYDPYYAPMQRPHRRQHQKKHRVPIDDDEEDDAYIPPRPIEIIDDDNFEED